MRLTAEQLQSVARTAANLYLENEYLIQTMISARLGRMLSREEFIQVTRRALEMIQID